MWTLFVNRFLPVLFSVAAIALLSQCVSSEEEGVEEAVSDTTDMATDDTDFPDLPGEDDDPMSGTEEDGTEEADDFELGDLGVGEPLEPYSPGNSVYFGFDAATFTAEGESELQNLAQYLLDNPSVKLKIIGHCDERGTNDYNLALGERRAEAVKNYLINSGVNASDLTTISLGEEQPAVFGSDEYSWSQNRRVEFELEF